MTPFILTTLKEDPSYLPAHRALADYYQRTGQPARAARHLEFVQRATGERPPAAAAPVSSRRPGG